MLDVLIVGCGNIAGGFDAEQPGARTPFTHAGAYQADGGYRLAGCVEPVQARRIAFQQRWQVARAYANLQEAVDDAPRYNVVSICSPTSQHASDLRTVLNLRPRLVFCEKPLTASLQESREIDALYKKAGIALLVNYTRRWDDRVRKLASELNTGHWGQIRSASAVYNKGLYNNGSHMLDLLSLLLGPLTVISAGPPRMDMWEQDPSIPAMLVTASGVPVTINCGHAADYSLFELELVTQRGTVKMENGGLDWSIRQAGPSATFAGYQALGASRHESGSIGGAALAAVAEIRAILAGQAEPSCTAEHALAVQQLCESIRRANQHSY
ncbi:Gfo/Idh/MocA family oxidoreductase [Laribacter hongkongensis]|uniref:Gfo/Idh/MocA family protein n=1 Tax=Laribacter hongkongensis TaxID=168471 RepID=UPI001EFC4DB6|nr:Gfo/Idh/MocA family oxidoreductase [Laribacter hongkongensis]MCG9051758.1 Gfo/Idh/MocA family oxidoreductase [Laribacter hongkongensis]